MRFPFVEVPGDPARVPRPILSVTVEGQDQPVSCLIDTGAIHNRWPREWADDAGIDLSDRESAHPGIGGRSVTCYLVEDVQVVVATQALNLAVWFCDDWEAPFGLLGQEGFLQYFGLHLDVSNGWFDLDELA